ncbi:hypothetical protein NEF87_000426 [Candidatus Lokiarchaeum ossiferum]|uniref:Major facilitator superfamily (MFS) profile domain-containing protein n=1 Tax=Candidatus Lokiarchaeum ossiferum TaxID=2951803 RepID=A0ABY6HKT3_9ARCH|nr:hypothetical protein NEF87_000426 [Candidatus Lokiarchaeum sp. B-35]
MTLSTDYESKWKNPEGSPVANNKAKKWRIFLGLSSFQILAMFRRGLFYTYLSIYMRSYLQLSVTITTLFATIPMLCSGFLQVFIWGRLSDKLQKRRTLIIVGEIIAAILILATYLIHAQISDFLIAGFVIIIGLSVTEIFWSMSNISWSALISDLYPSKDRSKIMGQLTSLGGAGRIVGALLGGLLYDGFGSKYPGWGFREGSLFIITVIIMGLSTIPMLLVPEGGIGNLPVTQKFERELIKSKKNTPSNKPKIPFLGFFILFIIALYVSNFGRNSTEVIYSQFLVLKDGFALSSQLLSYVVNIRSVAVIIVGITIGFLSNKLGHGNTFLIGIIIGIGALLLTAFTNSLVFVFIGSFFLGASEVIIGASSYAYAAQLIPEEHRAKMFSVYNAAFFLSWGIPSTLVTAPIIDKMINSGNAEVFAYQTSFLVGSIIALVGFSFLLGLEIYRKKHRIAVNEN